ncbi:MAG: hypothetical protein ABI886_08300 [Betaproteobacteria bacterium]
MTSLPSDAAPSPPAPVAVGTEGRLGIYPAADFRVTDGRDADAPTIRQALWYFRDETIAVPKPGLPVASFTPGVRTFDDVRAWAAARPADAPVDLPPLVWLAAPQVLRGARLSADATRLETAGDALPLRLVPKIPLNRSYFDASSAAFLRERTVAARGTVATDGFIARTLWPEDFRLGGDAPLRVLPKKRSAAKALRRMIRDVPRGGAASPFVANALWRRDAGDWTGRTVLAFMLNGAQGDDDEAHGGHFAIVTGQIEADGAIGNWLVDNFYTLDSESEKGILAAPVPLDDYLADLNAGQAWYRPSYLVVAVLSSPRAAELVQSALGRVYNQFYRHQLSYYHPDQNCTSISVDTLRALGWKVPGRGATSTVLGALTFPLIALKDRSISKAKLAFDYLNTDQTRMLPAAAFEQIFASLWAMAHDPGARAAGRSGTLGQMLAEDLTAIAWLRFPQLPSSRALGAAPAVTTWEYRAMVPADPAMAQIVPVPPRPFPDELRDPDLLPPLRPPSDIVAMVWGVLLVVGIPWVVRALWQRWRERGTGAAARER